MISRSPRRVWEFSFIRLYSSVVNHSITRNLPFSARQVFDVVSDVDKYAEFLPFCQQTRVIRRLSGEKFEADMTIGFRIFTETYRSLVVLEPCRRIKISAIDSNLFEYLHSIWNFADLATEKSSCKVEFSVEFKVASPVHSQAVKFFFADIAERQLVAFEKRCKEVYRGQKALKEVKDSSNDKIICFQDLKKRVAKDIEKVLGSKVQNFFTDEEFIKIIDIFDKFANSDRRLDGNAFCKASFELKERQKVFDKFRERHVFFACSKDPKLCCRVFESFQKSRHGDIDLYGFMYNMFFLCKADAWEQFCFSLHPLIAGEWSTYSDSMLTATQSHFRLRMEIIRTIMPEMVLRHLQPQISQTSAESGVLVLGSIGATSNVMNEIEEEIESITQKALEKSIFRGSRDRLVITQWMEVWKSHKDIVEMASIMGVSQLIDWALAIDSNKIPISIRNLFSAE